ncbi:unnamed protein product [Sphenostylis stenocarpa]|uniref:Uncharacterized protein n=1 Tax=Sphenostylis stenocarpa TaxID=92480 RepID=A0AA86VMD7_9FABA|nr:unnamed protein product [Sphenostylis stenocarpa]
MRTESQKMQIFVYTKGPKVDSPGCQMMKWIIFHLCIALFLQEGFFKKISQNYIEDMGCLIERKEVEEVEEKKKEKKCKESVNDIDTHHKSTLHAQITRPSHQISNLVV